MEDFEFALGESVTVGTQQGFVTGQATFAFEPDGYQILLVGDDGLPFKEWFDEHMILRGTLQ
jgi:hypothetical protein